MGGRINIAARFNDGQAICVEGWTNFIPRMIMNDTTLSGDDSVVRKTLLEVANHENYDGPQSFGAEGYGIVVIDFIEKTIHSMQGYTSFTGDKTIAHFIDFQESGWPKEDTAQIVLKAIDTGEMGEYKVTLSDEAESLLDGGRIRLVKINGESVEPRVIDKKQIVELNREDALLFLRNEKTKIPLLHVDVSPFKVVDYPENTSLFVMKEELKKSGFPLTKKDGLNSIFE